MRVKARVRVRERVKARGREIRVIERKRVRVRKTKRETGSLIWMIERAYDADPNSNKRMVAGRDEGPDEGKVVSSSY